MEKSSYSVKELTEIIYFSIQLTDLQYQKKENTVTHFNMKNPPSANMIKNLV